MIIKGRYSSSNVLNKIINLQERNIDLDRNSEFLSHFRSRLEYDSKIPDNEWKLIQDKISFKSAKRNTILLEYGNVEKAVRFLYSGVLKIICHDMESYIFDFRTRDDFLCDTQSLLNRHVSMFTFETITKCEWIQMESADFLKLVRQNTGLTNSMLKSIAYYAQRAHERETFIRIHSAEKRYREFCMSHSEIVKYAKIGDIASYLNITPQSLSRIRKNGN